jgi:hypothetical protein
MKKILIASLMMLAGIASAGEFIIKDEIRDGVKQVILTPEEPYSNVMVIFFVKEKAVEFQFQSLEHVAGIHISNPKALRWTPIKSNVFSIRFDANFDKVLADDYFLTSNLDAWCYQGKCNISKPRVIENIRGRIFSVVQPDGRVKQSLGLTTTPAEFEKLYSLYKGSKRIAIEVDGKQYTFNILS